MDTIMIQPTLAGTIKNANNPDLRAHFVPVGDHSPTLVPLKSMTITAAPSRRLTVPLSRLSHSKRAFPTSQRAEQAISGKNRLQSSQSEIRQRPHSRPPSPQEPINGDSTVISLRSHFPPARKTNQPHRNSGDILKRRKPQDTRNARPKTRPATTGRTVTSDGRKLHGLRIEPTACVCTELISIPQTRTGSCCES